MIKREKVTSAFKTHKDEEKNIKLVFGKPQGNIPFWETEA
jgi:hypothetical protein